MIKISNINFCEKTVENIEVNGDGLKEIKCEFYDNIFKITVMNNNDEVVDEVVKEEPTEDVIEEKVIEKLTIDDLKKIIYETIPKKILLRPTLEQLSKYMITLMKMT